MMEPGFSGLDHTRAHSLAGQERAHQIHIYHFAEYLLREVLEGAGYLGRSAGLGIDSGVT